MERNKIDVNALQAPNSYYYEIKRLEEEMTDHIHDLVWKYGKKVGDNYEMSTWDKHLRRYCLINDGEEVKTITKCIVLSPEKCQVRGHLMLQTDKGETTSFISLSHQEFNVYSQIYRIAMDIDTENRG